MVDQFTIWPVKQFYKDFQILEPIGQGQYGEVFKAKLISAREPIKDISKEIVAVKILKCSRASEKLRIKDEIELLKDLKHDNVLKLIGAYEKSDEIIQVLEYLGGGELFQRVIDCADNLSEVDIANQFIKQICSGISYIASLNVVHLDIKPENIVCSDTSKDCFVKLVDFGFARRLDDKNIRVMQGTPEFVSPEVVNYETISLKTDMWSVGVLTYVLLSGLSPFLGENNQYT